jgi:hypothetical protein
LEIGLDKNSDRFIIYKTGAEAITPRSTTSVIIGFLNLQRKLHTLAKGVDIPFFSQFLQA